MTDKYYKTNYSSPIGKILLIADEDENLISLSFECQKSLNNDIISKAAEKDNLEIFVAAKKWLDRYFNGENPAIDGIKLKLSGTDFQLSVWNILKKIPFGKTVTYGEIAKQIKNKSGGKKMSAQAVGNAVSRNPILIIIPCHRIIGTNGNLVGYSGGIEVKRKLLEFEKLALRV